jgi:hypothetical protein
VANNTADLVDVSNGQSFNAPSKIVTPSVSPVEDDAKLGEILYSHVNDVTTDVAAGNYFAAALTSTDSTVRWPRVASNASTKYECIILVKDLNTVSAANIDLQAATLVTVTNRAWDATATFNPKVCKQSMGGMVYESTFGIDLTTFGTSVSTTSYYIDFELYIDNDGTLDDVNAW